MERSIVFAIAGGSAVLGGVVGGLVTAWAAGSEKPRPGPGAASAEERPAVADPGAAVRFSSIEQRLRALELRRDAALRGASAGSARPGDPQAPDGRGVDSPTLVDDPVFEAAVRDVLDRAEEDRAGERQVRREERRRAEVQRWTDRLDERLSLNPTQKAKLTEIATDYWTRVRGLWEGDGGAPPPRDVRLNQVRAARDQADAAIRQALDARQAAQYETLDDELKLGARRFGRGGFGQ